MSWGLRTVPKRPHDRQRSQSLSDLVSCTSDERAAEWFIRLAPLQRKPFCAVGFGRVSELRDEAPCI